MSKEIHYRVFTADEYTGPILPANGVTNVLVDKNSKETPKTRKPLFLNTVRPSKEVSRRPKAWPKNIATMITTKALRQKESTKAFTTKTTPITKATLPTLTTRAARTTTPKPRTNGFRGKSLVSEIDPDIKRTTMKESSTGLVEIVEMTTPTIQTSITTERNLRSGFIKIKAHSIIAANGTREVGGYIIH